MQPLARHDVVIGQPLAFSIFDGKGKLLLAQGQVVRSEIQLDTQSCFQCIQTPPNNGWDQAFGRCHRRNRPFLRHRNKSLYLLELVHT